MTLMIGTAGWTIPHGCRENFPAEGSALERYASRLRAVEVNSSFHRSHRPATWARWAGSVPEGFRFAVKLPKEISHVRKLEACEAPLGTFLDEVSGLGSKLAVLLLQLPPKLAFDETIAARFLDHLSRRTPARIACEPRHPSWFSGPADAFLDNLQIARVAADPAIVPAAAEPGGWRGLAYLRLHGSPDMYRSSYGDEALCRYASVLERQAHSGVDAWCMFDNTASSAALANACALSALVRDQQPAL